MVTRTLVDSPAGREVMAAPPALPVALQLGAEQAESVRRWLEGVLGWQVVEGAAQDPVPAVLVLHDHLAAVDTGGAAATAGSGELPSVLLLPDGCDAVTAAIAAARLAPAAVLGWPSDRERLSELAADLLAAPRHRSQTTARLVVGGSAGGVGTTTVALALGGLRAWSGVRTLTAVRGLGLPWRGVPTAALGGGDLWSVAEVSPGMDTLRIVRLLEHEPVPELLDPAIDSLVLDAGPDPDCDVLVCRPDAAGLVAMECTTAAAVVIVGEGPASGRRIAATAAGRRLVRVTWSARVARAGSLGRVPAGLPGAWIDRLRPLIAGNPVPGPGPP